MILLITFNAYMLNTTYPHLLAAMYKEHLIFSVVPQSNSRKTTMGTQWEMSDLQWPTPNVKTFGT